MATKIGKNCKVSMGANKVAGIGTWRMSGVSVAEFDDSEFGDDYKEYKLGMKDTGTISFSGLYDPADTNGQNTIRTAWENGTNITDIRFYVDNTSYYIPSTTDPVSRANIIAYDVGANKDGMVETSFTVRISGKLTLV